MSSRVDCEIESADLRLGDSLSDPGLIGPPPLNLSTPTDDRLARREIWVVAGTRDVRHALTDAALHLGIVAHALDWREADHRLTVEGPPRAVVVTDWDVRTNPAACRGFLVRGARLLVVRGMTVEGLDPDVMEHPNVSVLPLTLELDAFRDALARLDSPEEPEADGRGPSGRLDGPFAGLTPVAGRGPRITYRSEGTRSRPMHWASRRPHRRQAPGPNDPVGRSGRGDAEIVTFDPRPDGARGERWTRARRE